MLVIAAAVLLAFAQAQTATARTARAARTARTRREEGVATLRAKAPTDGAVEDAPAGADRVQAEIAEQLAACRTAAEQAQNAARAARGELEKVRAAAAQAVTSAQEAAQAAVQKVIADWDRSLAERTAELRQQLEQPKADSQAQIKAIQDQVHAAKAQAEQLASWQATAEQAQTAARGELEKVRAAAAQAVTSAQEAAQAAVQKVIADWDRSLAERTAELRQQLEQAKTDPKAQVKVVQARVDDAKAETDQLAKTMRDDPAERPARRPTRRPAKELPDRPPI